MHATALGRIKASIGWKGKEARKGERGKVERTSKRKTTRGRRLIRHIQFASSWRIGAYEEVVVRQRDIGAAKSAARCCYV